MSFESVPVCSWSSGVSLLKKVLRKKGQKSIHQLTIEQQELTLSPDLVEEGVALWLNGVENPLAQKRKSRFPIHGAFTRVVVLRQKFPMERACGANWQTSVKDICHFPVFSLCSSCCTWARKCPRNCWYLASSASSCIILRSACIRSSRS